MRPDRSDSAIIVPLLQQKEAWLHQCVESAVRQTVRVEVFAVVSRLTPRSNLDVLADIARQHDHLQILSAKCEGFAARINFGIRHASAPRVGLLLSDDWLETDAVEQCICRSGDIVSSDRTNYGADGITVYPESARTAAHYAALPDLESRADWLGHFLMFSREMLLDVGGVDENIGLTGADDYDLVWTLLEHGASVSIVESRLYNYRDHNGLRLSLRDPGEQIKDLIKVLEKHGVSGKRKRDLIAKHAKWYGRPQHTVVKEAEKPE